MFSFSWFSTFFIIQFLTTFQTILSVMHSQYLMYKHVRKETPYEGYIKQKQQVQEKKERIKYYEEILKFRESRYPQELMSQLEREINPFELSIDKLKEFYNSKFPQYSNQLVHEAVEYVFKRKCQQSEMVRESPMFIEQGSEIIRNGRKLQFEDFSYFYDKPSERPADLSASQHPAQPTDREDSPNSKLFQDIQAKTERFNRLLIDQINREKDKFENLQLISEDDQRNFVSAQDPTSRRDPRSDSFPRFREGDLIVKPEGGMETGRSDIEELNFLLGGLTMRGQEEQLGEFTGRSQGSSFTVKINKEVMENLYNARGKLKLDLVRRVVDRLKKDRQ